MSQRKHISRTSGTSQQPPAASRRRDAHRLVMTERDWWALRFVAEQYAARYDHLGELFALWKAQSVPWPQDMRKRNDAIYHVTKRWCLKGYAKAERLEAQEPVWIWPSPHGMTELGFSYRAFLPPHEMRRHISAVNRVRLQLAKTRPDDQWISERAIRATYPEKRAGITLPHTPDGILVTSHGKIAIEVELTAKSQERLAVILQKLAETYPQIWYFLGSDEAYQALMKAYKHLNALYQPQITFYRL